MKIFFLLISILFLSAAGNAQDFENVAASHGINTGFGFGTLGGGVSFADFNGDGWDDLTFSSKAGDSIHFYLNNNGILEKIPSLVPHTDESKQVVWVDFDNDGDKDLFVASFESPNKLYENTGGLNMVDISAAAGLIQEDDPTFGVSFGDYDRDGWLDFYLSNRVPVGGSFTNYMYRNNGNGTFANVTYLTNTSDTMKPSFCSVFFDYNNDGHQDIYIAEDKYYMPNVLFENNGDGTYKDVSDSSNTNVSIDAMNAGGADYDYDGDFDLYVTNGPPLPNVLLRNEGNGKFVDWTSNTGLGYGLLAWGANFFDYDNDHDLDLYVCAADPDDPNAMFVNTGLDTFLEPLENTGGLGGNDISFSYGNAIGDFNNDGRPDIAVSNAFLDHFALWENQEPDTSHWLKVRLEGTTSNRDGVGSLIEVYAGPVYMNRYTHCGEGYISQNSTYEHFGLGSYTTVDSLRVTWLSGMVSRIGDVAADQMLYIIEDDPYRNDCDSMVRWLSDTIQGGKYSAIDSIYAEGMIEAGSEVIMVAGNSLQFGHGVEFRLGSEFGAAVDPCPEPVSAPAPPGGFLNEPAFQRHLRLLSRAFRLLGIPDLQLEKLLAMKSGR